MFDQLIIDDKASLDDFCASVAERKITKPKKKSIKETVPFSNATYDFSAINGELYWDESTLEYVFEIIADSAEELEEKKIPFISWVMNVMNGKLHDPFIPDYHFKATFADIDCDDSEIEKSTIKVKFTAYPYMIANHKQIYTYAVPTVARGEIDCFVVNNSSHRITPTFVSDLNCVIKKGGSKFYVSPGETTDEKFMLEPGENRFTCYGDHETGTLRIEFYEEVF